MKKCILLLLLSLFVYSCSVTTETNVTCWRRRICVGDTYVYTRTPHYDGSYRSKNVRIINVTNNYIVIKDDDGREHRVRPHQIERHGKPIKVHHPSNPGRRGEGNQGRGRGNN